MNKDWMVHLFFFLHLLLCIDNLRLADIDFFFSNCVKFSSVVQSRGSLAILCLYLFYLHAC